MNCILLTLLLFLFFTTQLSLVDGFFRKETAMDSSMVLSGRNIETSSSNVSTRTTTTTSRKSSVRPNVQAVIEKEETEFRKRKKASSVSFDDDGDEDNTQPHDDLVFEGKFNYQSPLLPLSVLFRPQELLEFFLDPRNRDLVIKGGGKPIESIPPSRELYNEWTSQSQVVHSTPPNGKHEEILAVHSDVHIAPGLSISAVSYTGCKVMTNPRNSLPFYEFTLVKEDYKGKGSRPMVWVFDRITGSSQKENHDSPAAVSESAATTRNAPTSSMVGLHSTHHPHSGNSKTYALSRVTIEPDANEKGCRVCYYGHVKVVSKVPRGLSHILPLPRRTVEAKVSKSIVSQLEKEGVESIEKFSEALGRWVENRNDSHESNDADR